MKANELRIGNLVDLGNRIAKVIEINHLACVVIDLEETQDTIEDYERTKPIHLTEEWLLKFGFEIGRESSIMKHWKIGFNSLTHDWLFDIVWIKDVYGNNEQKPFYRNGRHEIKYVNQLQNLYFALTGEELTLKSE